MVSFHMERCIILCNETISLVYSSVVLCLLKCVVLCFLIAMSSYLFHPLALSYEDARGDCDMYYVVF